MDYKVWNDVSAKLVADGVIPQALSFAGAADLTTYINDVVTPVSYTHLDVYKRQDFYNRMFSCLMSFNGHMRMYLM